MRRNSSALEPSPLKRTSENSALQNRYPAAEDMDVRVFENFETLRIIYGMHLAKLSEVILRLVAISMVFFLSSVSLLTTSHSESRIAAACEGLFSKILQKSRVSYWLDSLGSGLEASGTENDELFDRFAVFWKLIEDAWQEELGRHGIRLRKNKLIIKSGIGGGGPAYKGAQLRTVFPVDFIERFLHRRISKVDDVLVFYVLAHEYGHHIQRVLAPSLSFRSKRHHDRAIYELHADALAGFVIGRLENLLDAEDREVSTESRSPTFG